MIALAAAALLCAGCTFSPPGLASCRAKTTTDDQLRQRLKACDRVIQLGAGGRDLELALDSRGETLRRLDQPDRALQDFSQALAINASDTYAQDDRGMVLLALHRPEQALEDFRVVALTRTYDPTVLNHLAIAERNLRQFDTAILDDNQAIALAPSWSPAWANRGLTYYQHHQWDLALADFGKALQLDPTDVPALNGKANAEWAKGDVPLAMQDLARALVASPRDGNVFASRAVLEAATGDRTGALRDANQVIAIHPTNAASYSLRSQVYLQLKDSAQALADADTAVRMPPHDPSDLNARCWTRAAANSQLKAARGDCQQALALRPNLTSARDSLALVTFREGRLADAISQYTAIVERDPSYTGARYMRGIARLRAGDRAGGAADVAAANAVDSRIAGEFAAVGLTP